MKRYEYKTVELKLKGWGIFHTKRADGFDDLINREGADGWRYVDTVPQTGVYGEVGRIKVVFERERIPPLPGQ